MVRSYTDAPAPVHKQPVRVRATAYEGEPLVLEWSLLSHAHNRSDISVIVRSEEPLAPAANRELDAESLRAQLDRLGNTAYMLAELVVDVRGRPFVPSSLLNQLRRQAVNLLAEQQAEVRPVIVRDAHTVLADAIGAAETNHEDSATANSAQLHLLVRTPEQLDEALALAADVPLGSITLDYLDLYGLRPAVERVQAAGITARVASPRVLKPNEQRIVNFLRRLECQVVVRSGGLLAAFQEGDRPTLIGDFSLNAANLLSANSYLQLGIERLTPTHDLNAAQVADLARELGPQKIEVIAYQHLPVFHTEHCVFCRFLSTGTSYRDCGHPCESHRVALRDDHGRVHPVMADVGCRNTVFGAEAQEASRHLELWRQAGIRHFRLEFVHETGAEVRQVVTAFGQALAGRIPPAELTKRLQREAPQGTTEGSLFIAPDYLELPLLQ